MAAANQTLLTPVECGLPHIRLSAVETVGDAKGLPLALFFHGITANAYVFQPVLEQLAGEFRCVSVDQRGHGRSDKPATGYGSDAFAEDIAGLVRHFGGRPALVVGHSLGARNGIVTAAKYPALIAGVVAIDFTPYIEDQVFTDLETRVNGGDKVFADEEEVKSYLAGRYKLMPADAVARRARWGYRPVEGGLRPLADPRAMTQIAAGLREDLEAPLRAVKVPVLLVRGKESKLVSPAAFARTRALRPDLPAVEIERADHYVPEEEPQATVDEIRKFWKATVLGKGTASVN